MLLHVYPQETAIFQTSSNEMMRTVAMWHPYLWNQNIHSKILLEKNVSI